MTTLDVRSAERMREVSRALFGAQYRLEVGAAIAASDGVVCMKDLATDLGDPPGIGSVNMELKVLERAGLLLRMPRTAGERRVFLLRQDSSYWALCEELKESARRVARQRSKQLDRPAIGPVSPA